ncbi:hypothetical protein DXG01_013506 [Tephrocybe rancida]|nr:hypothetical protein DXG01_013506 [Tephrocybe rancida]
MSLPTLTSSEGPTVKSWPHRLLRDVPTLTPYPSKKVTRQYHNQLIACQWQDGRTLRTSLLANKWETPYVPMVDLSNGTASQLKLRPQDVASEVTLVAYHSANQEVAGEALHDDQYSSTGVEIAVQDIPSSDENPQFDDLPGLPKTVEYFYYFTIENERFRKAFGSFMMPKITSALQLTSQVKPPPSDFLGVNVGFTSGSLVFVGLSEWQIPDESFLSGQFRDSQYLGDPGTGSGYRWTPDWDKGFMYALDGVFLITAFTEAIADKFVKDLEAAFKDSIEMTVLVKCKLRPTPHDQSNHFGYRGGMSNPQIRGATFETAAQPEIRYPGSSIIPMGTIVMGYDGDEDKYSRPDWAKDGTFMVTRHLNILAPEFDAFLLDHGPKVCPDLPAQTAADKLGARLFGRWKDGTPTELSPDKPDPSISSSEKRINNFTFDLSIHQRRCPYAAHMRKSNPRNDSDTIEDFSHEIRRQGISFGSEVTRNERKGNTTNDFRGTHFVCYASSIVRGFKYHQCVQCNDSMFPSGKDITPGMDPIVGQTDEDKGVLRFMTGTNPADEQRVMIFPDRFVNSRGGGYFFNPSISTLRNYVAKK